MTVDGSAARREYLFTMNRGDACSGCGFTQDVLSPTPSFDHFTEKKKERRKRKETKNILDCLRPLVMLERNVM